MAINESWDVNYGAGGVQNGANIPFAVSVPGSTVSFSYNSVTHELSIYATNPPTDPASVTIAGSLQSELGCSDDWQPACAQTHLVYDADDDIWQDSWEVPAGS